MILYKKVFPLGKGISFSDYINALRKKDFSDYVLAIDPIPSTEDYQTQIFFVAPLWRWGIAHALPDGMFLSKCTIQHLKGVDKFTLEASPKASNLFYAAIYVIFSIMLLVFALFLMIDENSFSSNNILLLAIIPLVLSAPPLLTYLRDKKLLDTVGSLGTTLEKDP